MSTLLGYLSAFTATKQPRVHCYGVGVQSTLTFKAVAQQAQSLRNQYSAAAGAKVALTLSANSDSLISLVALDGFVSDLILLPVDYAVPSGCHFHVTEKGQLRELNDFEPDRLPVRTLWGLLDEHDQVVEYPLDDLAANELVATGTADDPLRWGIMQEPAELAGLLVWLRALRTGEDIVLAQADRLTDLVERFTQAGVTAIAADARLWRNFIATSAVSQLPLRLGVVSGGIVDEPTLNRLQSIFFDSMIIHSFSNTAAGVSWLITDGEPGFPAEFFEENDNQVMMRLNDEGHLCVEFSGSGAAIDTGLIAEKRGDRVHLCGHRDHEVMVGGRPVYPEQVEQTLLKCQGVSDVQASSMPNPVLGELIRVDVLAPEYRSVSARRELKKLLQAYCREHLQPWQRPARYYFY